MVGVKTCPTCAAAAPDDAQWCPQCRADLSGIERDRPPVRTLGNWFYGDEFWNRLEGWQRFGLALVAVAVIAVAALLAVNSILP